MQDETAVRALCDQVREAAYALHKYLLHGHLEKVYENGLAHRLLKSGLIVEQQRPLSVCDEDGTVLGNYYADLFVNECLIVELKACERIANEHIAQVLGYLKAAKQRHALIINFGAPRFEIRKLAL